MALLETRGLTVTYGRVHANESVDLSIEEGRFVGLIGANGAGKTTFIDAISGFVWPASGSVRLDGVDVTRERADLRTRRGLVRTFQSLELFEDLTVIDNLVVADRTAEGRGGAGDSVFRRLGSRSAARERAASVLEQLGIAALGEQLPSSLPHGQRKLVGLARAIVSKPRLVLLDEPAAGLDVNESRALAQVLRGLLDHGITVFLVDHDMGLVLSVCDEIYVLDFGRIIAHGSPAEIRRDPRVLESYLGEGGGESQGAVAGPGGASAA